MFTGRSRLDSMFAIGVVGATIECTKASALLDHFAFFTNGTGNTGCLCGGTFDEFAFRIGATGNKWTEFPHFFDECIATFGAGFANLFVFWDE